MLVLVIEEFMSYIVEMESGAMIYIPSLYKCHLTTEIVCAKFPCLYVPVCCCNAKIVQISCFCFYLGISSPLNYNTQLRSSCTSLFLRNYNLCKINITVK
jgi:hypothetical protein